MLQYMLIVGIALSVAVLSNATNHKIVFKSVKQFTPIWNDKGSGADRDVSIWRPDDPQAGFYPLGDVAVASHSGPSEYALVVKELEAGALAPPSSFTEIWRDSGSGADADVRFFRMNPRWGYRCLGHVAFASHSRLPDVNKYRCVRSAYTRYTGTYLAIWNDKGSGARRDVGLFSNSEIESYDAVFANTFTAVASHRKPSGRPYLLRKSISIDQTELKAVDSNSDVAIKVIQGKDSQISWKDSGSGADRDLFLFRGVPPAGYVSAGDIPAPGYHKPSVVLTLKAVADDALRQPRDFRWIWNDAGSGADWDGSFWEPICPSGYVALGHYAMNRHGQKPSKSNSICVNRKYVVQGQWQWIWNDAGSGADHDVTVYKAIPKSSAGQGVQAMGAVRCHCGMNRIAYVLKASAIQYITGRSVTKYVIDNVRYQFNDRKNMASSPATLERLVIENQGNYPQSYGGREVSYTYSVTSDWSVAAGLEVGVSTTVESGIPKIATVSTTVSYKALFTYTTGKSVTRTKTGKTIVRPTVQGKSQMTVTVVGTRYVADIPYTARLVTHFADGSKNTQDNYKGVYRGTEVTETRIIYGPNVPLS